MALLSCTSVIELLMLKGTCFGTTCLAIWMMSFFWDRSTTSSRTLSSHNSVASAYKGLGAKLAYLESRAVLH